MFNEGPLKSRRFFAQPVPGNETEAPLAKVKTMCLGNFRQMRRSVAPYGTERPGISQTSIPTRCLPSPPSLLLLLLLFAQSPIFCNTQVHFEFGNVVFETCSGHGYVSITLELSQSGVFLNGCYSYWRRKGLLCPGFLSGGVVILRLSAHTHWWSSVFAMPPCCIFQSTPCSV